MKVSILCVSSPSGFIVTTMLPTVAANVIGYVTNFFMEEVFEAALGVNLTIMLVITTMYVFIFLKI